MTMLLMLQPMYLTGLFSEISHFRRSGLAARTLLLKTSLQTHVGNRIDGEHARKVREKWTEFVYAWLQKVMSQEDLSEKEGKKLIRISEEARNYLRALHDSAKAAASPGREMFFMQDYALRKCEQVLRISALYCLAKNDESLIVEIDEVQRAENFVNRAFDDAGWEIYQNSEEAKMVKNANRVVDFIAGRIFENRFFYNGIQPVLLMSDLMQYGPVRKKEELDKVLSHLIRGNKIMVGPFTYQENGQTKTRKGVFVINILPSPPGRGLYNGGSQTPLLV